MKKVNSSTIGLIAIWLMGSMAVAEQSQATGFSLKSATFGEAVLTFNIPNYEIENVTLNSQTFQRLKIAAARHTAAEGTPELPTITTFYAVEPGKSYRANVNVITSEMVDNVELLPWQSWAPVDEDAGVAFKRNIDVYTDDSPYPEQMAVVSQPAIFRDLELVTVSFTPFQYHPVDRRLEVMTTAEIELVETGTVATNSNRPLKRSRVFERLFESVVVNYQRDRLAEEYQKPSILYVLPSDPSNLMPTLNELFEWRHKAGYVVHTVSTSTTGSSNADIRDYIQNAYETWTDPPEYVALVGDVNGSYVIPTYFETHSNYHGEGDLPYTLFQGADLFPEVLIGRISFDSIIELITIVNKTIQYETDPYMGENWFTRACLVGDPTTSSGISTVITNEAVRQYMEVNGGYDDVRTVYSSPFASQMVDNLDEGVTFFNYRGWLGMSGFGSSDLNGLNNGFKLCVATVITCGTGSFEGGTSMSEAFIRAGTPALPKGGVAAIGTATLGTHTLFNNILDMGFYYGVFVDGLETPSAALARAKLSLLQTYPSNPNNNVTIFSHWNNLMGDPALMMWTAIPQDFDVTYANTIPRGTNFMDVHVADSDGNDLSGVFVTILKGSDEVFESGYTDATGYVNLPIDFSTAGVMSITATAKNFIPHQGEIQITEPDHNLNIIADQTVLDDDATPPSNGNGDGLVNSGEVIELTIPVHNYGTFVASNVSGVITALSSNVTVDPNANAVNYGNIDSNATAVPNETFVIQIANGVLEGQYIRLRLNIVDEDANEFEGMLLLNTVGSFLDIVNLDVIDDGDGVLDPGETADLKFWLANTGSIEANNVTAALNSSAPGLEIIDASSTWGTIYPDQDTPSIEHFTVTVHENTLSGTMVNLFLNITSENGVNVTKVFVLQLGTVTETDPLGPDEYGYYIYDNGDVSYTAAPLYDWIEIDTQYGGSGTQTPITDGGDGDYGNYVHSIELPFTFRFYGQMVNTITICSNGWIAMRQTTMGSFRNYPIPGPGGPSPMIAAFWDDLTTTQGQGHVFTYYDAEHHQFIVQWSRMRTYTNNSEETFQAILRDPEHYLSPTGDGDILIQYHTFNNTSTWSGIIHGAYSTIGIEDATASKGLQYTFNNQYPSAAMTLQNETALLITTRGSTIRMRGDVNYDGELNVMDILVLVDHIRGGNTGDLNPYIADMNSDGSINLQDMIIMVFQIIIN